MNRSNETAIFRPGDKVLFDGKAATILAPFMDEDLDGNPVQGLCSEDEPQLLWVIQFDDGRIKKWACQHSMGHVSDE